MVCHFSRLHWLWLSIILSHVSKHTAWKVWCPFYAIWNVFSYLSQKATLIQVQEAMLTIERFTVKLHHRISNCFNINECRKEFFCQGRSIDNILPTSVAFWKHTPWKCYTQGMCGPSPWLKSKLYQYQRIGDQNSKITSWYLT